MKRPVLMACAALGIMAFAAQAHAFTILNADNYATGGRANMIDPDEHLQETPSQNQAPADGQGLHLNGNGGILGATGAAQVYGSTGYDGMPYFPGSNNHMTPGANVGMLQYGVNGLHPGAWNNW